MNRSSNFFDYRKRHRCFFFDGWETEQAEEFDRIRFLFRIDDNLSFQPELQFPRSLQLLSLSDSWIFHLGLIESVSYWKSYCPQRFHLQSFQLDSEQVQWWRDLFWLGLGEFRYINQLTEIEKDDFCPEFTFSRDTKVFAPPEAVLPSDASWLIPMGGGKDSALCLQLAVNAGLSAKPFAVNPVPSVDTCINSIDPTLPCIRIKRVICPRLIEENDKGALNGHTPFSAVIAFLSSAVAEATGCKHIVPSNESSANEPNLEDSEINHQYSKSYSFEKLFREYLNRYLNPELNYFSGLRPFNEVQVVDMVFKNPAINRDFVSCNRQGGNGTWCKRCAKCLFTALALGGIGGPDAIKEIFEQNILIFPDNQSVLFEILGLGQHKSFDCVGTIQESRSCLNSFLRQVEKDKYPELRNLAKKFGHVPNLQTFLNAWDNEHFCPENWVQMLKTALDSNREPS